eukprot:m.14283 g.14283  ORF g.14283 m.14283 type:complete len:378 (-) comp10069_c0_seq1:193-1326(-)
MVRLRLVVAVLLLAIAVTRWKTIGDLTQRLARITSEHVTPEAKTSTAIRFGMLGTAGIAKFALLWPARKLDNVIVHGVASRDVTRATDHAIKFNIPHVFESYEQLIASPEIDAVYISLPSRLHFSWVRKCIQAGKDVLIEKPIALTVSETSEIYRMASEHGVVVMEGYHYRYHPVARRLQQLLHFDAFGTIEEVSIEFSMLHFGFLWSQARSTPPNADHQRIKMFDRWCYCVDILVMMFGVEVDDATVHDVQITHGTFLANISFKSAHGVKPIKVRLLATRGTVELPKWNVNVRGTQGITTVHNIGFPFLWHAIENGTSMTLEKHYGDGSTTYEHQLRAFVAEVTGARRPDEFMRHSVSTMTLVDRILVASGQPPFK